MFPATPAPIGPVVGTTMFPHWQLAQRDSGSKQLRSPSWLRLSIGDEHCGARRRGNLLWHERRHELPVRRTRVLEKTHIYSLPKTISITSSPPLSNPVSGWPDAAARNEVRNLGAVGIRKLQRSGYWHGPQCRNLSMESRHAAPAARTDRNRGRLFGEPQHALAMGGRVGHFHPRSKFPSIEHSQRIWCRIESDSHDPNSNAVTIILTRKSRIRSNASSWRSRSPASYCPATSGLQSPPTWQTPATLIPRFRRQFCCDRSRSLMAVSRACRLLVANSWYHSLQIRFQKRASHYISFEGNYTLLES